MKGECTVEVTVRESCYLVFAAEFYRQPMQFILTVVLCGLVYVSSEQAVLRCSEQSTYRFRRQAGQD